MMLYFHRCWSDLYSWCMQYMESLQKPLGLMVSKQVCIKIYMTLRI